VLCRRWYCKATRTALPLSLALQYRSTAVPQYGNTAPHYYYITTITLIIIIITFIITTNTNTNTPPPDSDTVSEQQVGVSSTLSRGAIVIPCSARETFAVDRQT